MSNQSIFGKYVFTCFGGKEGRPFNICIIMLTETNATSDFFKDGEMWRRSFRAIERKKKGKGGGEGVMQNREAESCRGERAKPEMDGEKVGGG